MDINWGFVTEGATFEALMQTIVFYEDAKAILFRRPGRDYAQDAKSGDGQTIYQAKYIQEESAATAIARAKDELTKIASYRGGQGIAAQVWKDARNWVLVTNAEFNPNNTLKWENEVVPLFEEEKLEATYWDKGKVEGYIRKYPDLFRSFFAGEPRSFLALTEAFQMLRTQHVFEEALLVDFQARDAELKAFDDFLKGSERFLIIHGRGGVGKTRLVLQAASETAATTGWQVLWANLETLATSAAWFLGLVPERPTLVIADDPEDPRVLRALAEQVATQTGRVPNWKLVVTARSPNDPVLQHFTKPMFSRLRRELPLDELPKDSAVKIAKELLSRIPVFSALPDDERERVAKGIAAAASNNAIWVAVAAKLLASGESNLSALPTDPEGLATAYVNEIVERQSQFQPAQLRNTLRWLALGRPLNTEDEKSMALIEHNCAFQQRTEFEQCLQRLLERRVVVKRGARDRLLEIKPDVIADYVLRHWLIYKTEFGEKGWKPTIDAVNLGNSIYEALSLGPLSPLGQQILGSLVRLEFLQKLNGEEVDILGTILQKVHTDVHAWPTSVKLSLIENLHSVAATRGPLVSDVIKTLLASDSEPEEVEGVFGKQHLSHTDVLLDLSWLAFSVACFAVEPKDKYSVLRLMAELVIKEAGVQRPRGLPNDGKRAKDVLRRTVEAGNDFQADSYDKEAADLAQGLLRALPESKTPTEDLLVLDALLTPLLAVERQRSYQTSELQMVVERYLLRPADPESRIRNDLITTLRATLEMSQPTEGIRIALWKKLSESHSSAHRACRAFAEVAKKETANQKAGEELLAMSAELHEQLLEDLAWTAGYIKRRSPGLQEMKAARSVWEWYCRFEKEDTGLKQAAELLEALFQGDPVRETYDALTSYDDLDGAKIRAELCANALASKNNPDLIREFIRNGVSYLGDPAEVTRLFQVAAHLGNSAPDATGIQSFVRQSLTASVPKEEFQFAAFILSSWIRQVRAKGGDPIDILAPIAQRITEQSQIVSFVGSLYGSNWHDEITIKEAAFVCSCLPAFQWTNQLDVFLGILGCMAQFIDEPFYSDALRQAFALIPPADALRGYERYLKSTQVSVRCRKNALLLTVIRIRGISATRARICGGCSWEAEGRPGMRGGREGA